MNHSRIETFLEKMYQQEFFSRQVCFYHKEPSKSPSWVDFPEEIDPLLKQYFATQGIHQLYSHQREMWEWSQQNEHVVLVTSTASGKTLSYQLPVLQSCLHENATALYLFPTKALAYDQLRSLQEITSFLAEKGVSLRAENFDGDTPSHKRKTIRDKAQMILSNPDMLHFGILPNHSHWSNFLERLRYVVVDEAHMYRGVFGSHVANLFRRLKRILGKKADSLQFLFTSATIQNPAELTSLLIEDSVRAITQDGSGHGPKTYLYYNPPMIDAELGLRKSMLKEAVSLGKALFESQAQSVVFARTRQNMELILTYLQKRIESPKDKRLRGYRSGYLPKLRREIEQQLKQREIDMVISTNALEVGIDIGSLEAVLVAGYPGTIASTKQQMGRAGRGFEESLACLLFSSSPLEQFLAKHPSLIHEGTPEKAFVDPNNLFILMQHLKCATFEKPFVLGEDFGLIPSHEVQVLLEYLQEQSAIRKVEDTYFWTQSTSPVQEVSLRNASAQRIDLMVERRSKKFRLGQVDMQSSLWMVHPDAIYIHEGETYWVKELNLEEGQAILHEASPEHYTQAHKETSIEVLEIFENDSIKRGNRYWGDIRITSQVTRFQKIQWGTHKKLGTSLLDLPETELETQGFWFSLDTDLVDELMEKGYWRNHPNDYGELWESIRQMVRQRDAFVCQLCGCAEGKKEHDVHHKRPFRLFQSKEEANDLGNLLLLCRDCHQRAEKTVMVRSGLAGLAYLLEQLAPLYLMCDPRDLGTHVEPKADFSNQQATLLFHDTVMGGMGLCEQLYEIHGSLFQNAISVIENCACLDGCPSCVGPGGEQGEGSKKETLAILLALAR